MFGSNPYKLFGYLSDVNMKLDHFAKIDKI